jgi:hypothetical protein
MQREQLGHVRAQVRVHDAGRVNERVGGAHVRVYVRRDTFSASCTFRPH